MPGGGRGPSVAKTSAARLRAQRSLSPEGHRSSSLPPPAHRNVPSTPPPCMCASLTVPSCKSLRLYSIRPHMTEYRFIILICKIHLPLLSTFPFLTNHKRDYKEHSLLFCEHLQNKLNACTCTAMTHTRIPSVCGHSETDQVFAHVSIKVKAF